MPAGRPAGSLNRPKRALIQLLEETLPGYSPVIEMAKIAQDMNNDLSTRLSAHKEVAQYITPKLKAVEVQMEGRLDARIGWLDSHSVQSEATPGDST